MSRFFSFAVLTLLAVGSWAQTQQINLSMFATDLKNCDATSACDAMVKIMCDPGTGSWTECGQTSEVKDDNYPVWPERFSFTYNVEAGQRWRFDVIDKDVLIDDPIGSITTTIEEYVTGTPVYETKRFDLEGRGYLMVHRREM